VIADLKRNNLFYCFITPIPPFLLYFFQGDEAHVFKVCTLSITNLSITKSKFTRKEEIIKMRNEQLNIQKLSVPVPRKMSKNFTENAASFSFKKSGNTQ